jgi:hypothetical protein
MKKETTKKGMGAGAIIGISAGVAALGAMTYYFLGPEGKKHQKNFKAWTVKMKAEIIDKLENAGDVTEAVYHKIVDKAAEAYQKSGKATAEEVAMYADMLKKQWKHIAGGTKKKPAKKKAAPAKKSAKKAVKKAAKKTA